MEDCDWSEFLLEAYDWLKFSTEARDCSEFCTEVGRRAWKAAGHMKKYEENKKKEKNMKKYAGIIKEL